MTVHYVDFENGNDSNNGLSFADRKKNLSSVIPQTGDEIRVMATSPATSIGNATWGQQAWGKADYPFQVFDEGGAIRVELTTSSTGYYIDNTYALITGSTLTTLNGLWKVSSHANGGYLLQGSNFATLGVSTGNSAGGGEMKSINGKIVRIPQELVSDISPNAWTAATVANPIQGWVNVLGSVDGVTNGSSYYPGGNPGFQSYPGSSWRIAWNSNGSDVTVTQHTYVDNRNATTSWSNVASYYYGYTNYSPTRYMGYYYRHIFGTSTYYYAAYNSNSYVQFGTSYTYPEVFPVDHNSPPVRQYQIGARNSEFYDIKYKVVSASNSSTWSDISSSNGYLIWFKGNRQDTDSPTVRPSGAGEIEYTIYYFTANTIKNNSVVQIDIHENKDWELQYIQPSTEVVDGYYDLGTKFVTSGVAANTTAFHHNYSTTRDLSAFDSLSFFMSVNGSFTNDWKLRLHQGAYDSGAAYVEVALPVTTTGSSYEPVSVNFGSALPNNVQAISIHYSGSTAVSGSASFSISNILATSSTGIGFDSLIGRNEAGSKSWYKIGALRYMNNETLVSIANPAGYAESYDGGLCYYGSGIRSQAPNLNDTANFASDTVTTYIRAPYQLSSMQQVYARDRYQVLGGWDRTDMSTQNDITMLQAPSGSDAIKVWDCDGFYIENFYVHGGINAYNIEQSFGSELVNCSAGYADQGMYLHVSSSSIVSNSTFTGCEKGVYYDDSSNCDLRSVVIDGCRTGVDVTNDSVENNTYDLVCRGSLLEAKDYYHTMGNVDFNPYILSHGDCYNANASWGNKVYGGLVQQGLYKVSGKYMFRNTYNAEIEFVDLEDISSYSTYEITDFDWANNSLFLSAADGSLIRWWQEVGITLSKNSSITSPNGSLPNGNSDSGNNVYKWERLSTKERGMQYPPNFNIASPRMKLGDIPCSAGTTITVTAKVAHYNLNYGRIFIRCDAAESTIGLTDDVEDWWHNPTSTYDTSWHTYSTDITANQTGVAAVYMYYGTTTTSAGTNTRVYFTDLQITSV